ncbi:MAG: DUF1449 domain-containing protein [Planctomycetota bacterium]
MLLLEIVTSHVERPLIVPAPLIELAERMFVGPVWPASILVVLLVVYTLLALIGLIDFGFDVPDVDLDPGVDIDVPDIGGIDVPDLDVPDVAVDVPDVAVDVPDGANIGVDFLQGLGAYTVRLTNFGRIPVVLWGGIFAVTFWSLSYGLWHNYDADKYDPTWFPSILLGIRNFVIAVAITKGVTQPMLGWFVDPPSYDHRKLMGATCEICTTEATPEFGQAKFRTNASPLLLNVRTDGAHIAKGTEVRIIGFDKEKRIYKVTQLQPETQS